MQVLTKLDGYDMTLDILKETGVGKVVNTMKKRQGEVSDKAKALVRLLDYAGLCWIMLDYARLC